MIKFETVRYQHMIDTCLVYDIDTLIDLQNEIHDVITKLKKNPDIHNLNIKSISIDHTDDRVGSVNNFSIKRSWHALITYECDREAVD